MPLEGKAFLALWNDRSPDRNDYDVWHSREHVPERLTVPGMIRAGRYANGKGNLPGYYTLYVLEDISVLDRPEYVHLLNNPSPWSRSMRPDFLRFFRLPCTTLMSTGGGVGGWAVLCLIPEEPRKDDLAALVDDLARQAPVTAVHCGARDTSSANVPFSISTDDTEDPYGVLMIEGFDGPGLEEATGRVLAAHASGVAVKDVTSYNLAFLLKAESVPHVHPYPQANTPQS